ncbi:MAG: hypothetical protein CL897_05265 [Dehalococcoidia bacterium]|nr:hypothetical protein [Dehalococcoidia bacterium]HCV00261.1 hypothetical protein [Dehalococcoidia bacterium]
MITDQIAAVRQELLQRPAGLVRHVERVLDEAIPLAALWGADKERVELSVWGHDLFRAKSPTEQLRLAKEVGVEIDEDAKAYPILLHGPIAATVLRERFRLTDEEALMAVRDHTSGLDQMSLLAKILLIADKIEKRKRQGAPELADVRQLARRDLDTAILCWSDWRWATEAREGYRIQASHWRARQHWVEEHHAEIGMPPRATGRAFAAAARREGLAPSRE